MSLREINIPPFLGVAQATEPARVIFALVDMDDEPLLGLYADSGASISGRLVADVGALAVTVDVTPNTEIAPASQYLIVAEAQGATDVYRLQVPASGVALDWDDLIQLGDPLDPADLEPWVTHLADDDRHLSTDERAALSAANAPNAGNPLATLVDVVSAGGGDMHTLTYDPTGVSADAFDLSHSVGNIDCGTF